MFLSKTKMNAVFGLVPFLFFCVGCASVPTVPQNRPEICSPILYEGRVSAVTIVPVIDLRKNKACPIAFEELDKVVKAYVVQAGYRVTMLGRTSRFESLNERNANDDWFHAYANEMATGAEYVLMVAVEDVSCSKGLFQSSVNFAMSAVLVQGSNGDILWRDRFVNYSYSDIGLLASSMFALSYNTKDWANQTPQWTGQVLITLPEVKAKGVVNNANGSNSVSKVASDLVGVRK